MCNNCSNLKYFVFKLENDRVKSSTIESEVGNSLQSCLLVESWLEALLLVGQMPDLNEKLQI